MNSEDLASVPSSSTRLNETFLPWFLNIATRNLRMPRGGRFLPYRNPKGYTVSEHIATKFEGNQWILSTPKKEKSTQSIKPGANIETSVVGTLGILVVFVKIQIGQGSYTSGIFSGRPYMSPFISIFKFW